MKMFMRKKDIYMGKIFVTPNPNPICVNRLFANAMLSTDQNDTRVSHASSSAKIVPVRLDKKLAQPKTKPEGATNKPADSESGVSE